MNVPTGYTDRTFKSNPDTETLLYGDEIKEGMIVLLEGSVIYEDPSIVDNPDADGYAVRRLNENQRWCRVDTIRRDRHDRDLLCFIGTYGDGSQYTRTYNKSYAWYVKLNSISAPDFN